MDTEKLEDQAKDKIDALKTLNPKQRRAVGVLIGVVIVLMVAFGIFFAVKVRAETFVDIDCAKLPGYCIVHQSTLRAMVVTNQNLTKALSDALARTPACDEKNRT